VENAKTKQSTGVAAGDDEEETNSGAPEQVAPTENRIVIIADTKQVR
jgi:hypothetical protein